MRNYIIVPASKNNPWTNYLRNEILKISKRTSIVNLNFNLINNQINLIGKLNNETVIIANFATTSGFQSGLLKKNGAKIICVCYGSDVLLAHTFFRKLRLIFAFAFCDYIFTTSRSNYELDLKIQRYNFFKKKVKNFQFSPKIYVQNSDRKKISLLSVRHCREIYNIKEIIYSFSRNIDKFKKIGVEKLTILEGFSDEKYLLELKRYVEINNLNENIEFVPGNLSQLQFQEFVSLAEVIISVPVSDLLGGPVQEAFHLSAKPILTTLPAYTSALKEFDVSWINIEEFNADDWLYDSYIKTHKINTQKNKILANRYFNHEDNFREISQVLNELF